MAQRQRNVTNIKPIKNKILDLETKRMIQYVSLSIKTVKDRKYNCWWCSLIIEHEPIGCPLSFKEGTYYTDGLFCSANCVKAYVLEYCQNDSRFKDSVRLLSLMVAEGTSRRKDQEPITIQPSPHWRLLIQFGGHVTPEKFKDLTNHTVFTEKGIIQMKPITILLEEDEKF